MSGPFAAAAPAKVNLCLHVNGRRDDGYHLVDSLVAFASLADRVEVSEAVGLSVEVSGPFADRLGDPADNLAAAAARTLAERAGRAADVRIRVEKNIPVAAGLGGGSADAAAALRLLGRLWNLAEAPLAEVAPALGADVPVCLAAAAARVTGIGEAVAPVPPLPPAGLVLVNPGCPLETAAVFRAYAESASEGTAPVPSPTGPFADVRALAESLAPASNDLTRAACSLVPAIGEVLATVEATPGCLLARMAGSGPSVFGLYETRERAAAAARLLAGAVRGWWSWGGGFAGAAVAELR